MVPAVTRFDRKTLSHDSGVHTNTKRVAFVLRPCCFYLPALSQSRGDFEEFVRLFFRFLTWILHSPSNVYFRYMQMLTLEVIGT